MKWPAGLECRGKTRFLASITVAFAFYSGVALGQLDARWINPNGGSWGIAANWTTPEYPNNGAQTYNATIDLGGGPYAVRLARPITIDSFLLDSGAATLNHLTGAFRVLGGASLLTGVYRLDGGTIAGGTWDVASAAFEISGSSFNRMDAVTFNGDLVLGAAGARLTVSNGLTLNGSVLLEGAGCRLTFDGIQNLAGTAIVFNSYGWHAAMDDETTAGTKYVSVAGGGMLAIGADVVIRGGRGVVEGSGSIANAGRLSADAAGYGLSVWPLSFSNAGTLEALGGATLAIGSAGTSWANLNGGLVFADSATLTMSGAWNNTGTIDTVDSTVNLGGTFATPDLGVFQRTGGTVNLTGMLDNTGHVLMLDAQTGTWQLNGGTISGGALDFANGEILLFTRNTSNYLVGVAILPALRIPYDFATVRFGAGTTFGGPITLEGRGGILGFDVGQTLDNISIVFGGAPDSIHVISAEGSGTLTLGPGSVIQGQSGRIVDGRFGSGGSTIVNEGLISANAAVRNFEVAPTVFRNEGVMEALNASVMYLGWDSAGARSDSWVNGAGGMIRATDSTLDFWGNWANQGNIVATDSTVNLRGRFTLDDLGTFVRTRGRVNLMGHLDHAGATLNLNATTGSWHLRNATITGGTVNFAEGARFEFGWSGGGSVPISLLDGVTINGDLVIRRGSDTSTGIVHFAGGTRVNGNIEVGDRGTLRVDGGQVLDDTTITLGGPIPDTGSLAVANGALTFGPNLAIRAGRGEILGGAGDSLVNQGVLTAEGTGARLTVNTVDFENQGTMSATDGGLLFIGGSRTSNWRNAANGRIIATNATVLCGSDWENHGLLRFVDTVAQFNRGSPADPWTNFGTIEAVNSTLELSGQWDNDGVIDVTDTAVELAGQLTTESIGTFNRSGGTVRITGLLDNSASTLNLNTQTGSWQLDNGTILGGTIAQTGGARLQFASNGQNSTLDGVSIIGDLHVDGIVNVVNGIAVNGDIYVDGGEMRIPTGSVFDDVRVRLTGGLMSKGLGTLTLGSRLTIAGRNGRISNYSGERATIINQGRATVHVGQTLTIDPNHFENEGLLAADSSGTLRIGLFSTGTWRNAASGSILVDDATLELTGSWENAGTIQVLDAVLQLSGTYRTVGFQSIQIQGGLVIFGGALDNQGETLVIDSRADEWRLNGSIRGGAVTAREGAILNAFSSRLDGVELVELDLLIHDRWIVYVESGGLVLSNATITFRGVSIGRDTELVFLTSQTLGGNGEIVFDALDWEHRVTGAAGTTLTIGPGILIHGYRGNVGHYYQTDRRGLINQGKIIADVPDGLIRVSAQALLTNEGLLAAKNGARLWVSTTDSLSNFSGGTLTDGSWHSFADSTLDLESLSVTTNAADVLLSGQASRFDAINALQRNLGRFAIADGRNFNTSGSLENEGTLLAGVGSTLSVNGAFVQHPSGVLAIELGGRTPGSEYGTVDVSGPADLSGDLEVHLANNFIPAGNDRFEVLTATALNGTFDSVRLAGSPAGLRVEVVYSSTSVTVIVKRRGDMTCDGRFNGADIDAFFLALGDPTAWQLAHPGCDILSGDMNGDGRVDGADIDPFFQCLGGGNCP